MAQGKTSYVDVIEQLVRQPQGLFRLGRFIVTLGVIGCVMILGTLWTATELFARSGVATFELSVTGLTITMRDAEARAEEFLRSVDPHAWESTGIRLRVGDRVRFFATGRINIDMPGLINAVLLRLSLEARVAQAKRIDRRSTQPDQTPEFHWAALLTPREREALTLWKPWCGPDGIPDEGPSPRAFAARTGRRLMPNERLGSLIGAIVPENSSPARQQAFYIGRDMRGGELIVESAGTLFVSVNDIVDVHNKQDGGPYWDDNLGSYSVTISVLRAR
jgi:hypothetical protein